MTDIDPQDDPRPTLEDIDAHLESWTKIIQQSTEYHILKIYYRTTPVNKPAKESKIIQV